jgi:hypothetical protein
VNRIVPRFTRNRKVSVWCALTAVTCLSCACHHPSPIQTPTTMGTIAPSTSVPNESMVYALQGGSNIEVLSLNTGASSITGSLYYEYNCGENQTQSGPTLSVDGTSSGSSSLDLTFEGISGTFQATTNDSDLTLTSSSGGSESFVQSNTSQITRAALSLPSVSSISGDTCSDLPPNTGP